jgi:hypothetical protein
VAVVEEQVLERVARLEQLWAEPKNAKTFFTTVDHKKIGKR